MDQTPESRIRIGIGGLFLLLVAAVVSFFMLLMTTFASDSGPNPVYYGMLAFTLSILPVCAVLSGIAVWKRKSRILMYGFWYTFSPILAFLAFGLVIGTLTALQ